MLQLFFIALKKLYLYILILNLNLDLSTIGKVNFFLSIGNALKPSFKILIYFL